MHQLDSVSLAIVLESQSVLSKTMHILSKLIFTRF